MKIWVSTAHYEFTDEAEALAVLERDLARSNHPPGGHLGEIDDYVVELRSRAAGKGAGR